jgi:AraC-like DNA-binding protein
MDKTLSYAENNKELILVTKHDLIKSIRTHNHDFIEIVFVIEGSCEHIYYGNKTILKPGDVFIILPYEKHSYQVNNNITLYNCIFYPEALGIDWIKMKVYSDMYDMLVVEPFFREEMKKCTFITLDKREITFYDALLSYMENELSDKLSGYNMAVRSALFTLLSSLSRSWCRHHEFMGNKFIQKRDMMDSAFKFIDNNLDKNLKLDDIAANVFLSPHHFSKVFKEKTGFTPMDYINKKRIEVSEELLKSTEMSISDIAARVGIFDANYFTKIFKKSKACTPSEFRRYNGVH